jgi:hypothetical protein
MWLAAELMALDEERKVTLGEVAKVDACGRGRKAREVSHT